METLINISSAIGTAAIILGALKPILTKLPPNIAVPLYTMITVSGYVDGFFKALVHGLDDAAKKK